MKSSPLFPSVLASICIEKVATETSKGTDMDPSGIPGWCLLFLKQRADVQFPHFLLILCCSHKEEEEDGENVRKINEPVRKKQKLERACKHVYTNTYSCTVVGVI